jgi:hypothetical protein
MGAAQSTSTSQPTANEPPTSPSSVPSYQQGPTTDLPNLPSVQNMPSVAAPTSEEHAAANELHQEIENKRVVIDQNMVKSLAELGGLMKQYNKNDVPQMLHDIESSGIKLPKTIVDRLRVTHQSILDNIDSVYTYEEKGKKLEINSAVADYIQKDVDKDLDKQLTEYMDNPFIKDDPMVQRGVKDVADSIKSIRGKYKFFEYKYLQMNVFLIGFITHVGETLVRFVNETSAFYEAKEKYHLMLIRNLVKTFHDQLEVDASDTGGKIDATTIGDSLKELTQSVIDSIAKQKEFTEKSKQQSLQDILKFLMERESEFADELVGIVDRYKTEKSKGQYQSNRQQPTGRTRSAVQSQYDYNKRMQLQLEREREIQRLREEQHQRQLELAREASMRYGSRYPSTTTTTAAPPTARYNNSAYRYRRRSMYGGFVRDASFFPPTEYTENPATEAAQQLQDLAQPQSGGFLRDSSFLPQRFYDI